MTYYARSPKKSKGIEAQTYADHIDNVVRRANEYAKATSRYAAYDGETLRSVVDSSSRIHDLGKLDAENQSILSGEKTAERLTKTHYDAGTAYCISGQDSSPLSAVIVQGHHIGLADFVAESNRGSLAFRDGDIKDEIDAKLPDYLAIHNELIASGPDTGGVEGVHGDLPVFLRIALSCLADADHGDAARHNGNEPADAPIISLRAGERLNRLDAYVAELCQRGTDKGRTLLRQEMYAACRNASPDGNIASCDSPVGSGKTTADMAHLLAQAQARGLRRIVVVLPFTNIITQSVEVYRKALVLPGERAEDVVAELHHRADFENDEARHLTALWRAPIIVTTAVAFFETLASKTPSRLRRLHELPGSAIFVDESHAMLQAQHLPLAWRWINAYARDWGCYWLLASGSLCRFWEIGAIAGEHTAHVPEIVSDELRDKLSTYETKRIAYRADLSPKGIDELAEWVHGFEGPRLVIMNTVQNAAVLAAHIRDRYGREHVEHLSSALTPLDRKTTLDRIKDRLDDKKDKDWVLVATSCVEAGVDLSFKTGFRELASLISLLQAAGRINREGTDGAAEIHSFCLGKNALLNANPGVQEASDVLRGYFDRGIAISPQLSTKSIEDEITLYGLSRKHVELVQYEEQRCFPQVEENFRVIESYTQLAVVDEGIVNQIRYGKVDWRKLQMHSVQISVYKLDEVHAPEILSGIRHWNLGYDDFLGYMAGVLPLKRLEADGMIL